MGGQVVRVGDGAFSVWTEVHQDIRKSTQDEEEKGRGPIEGIISTQRRDQQDEVVMQDGVDWSYFLSKGFFNWEHEKGPENVLGEATAVEACTHKGAPATRVRGFLYLKKPKAREIYETITAMAHAESTRKIGFSVEGGVVQRQGKTVLKSRVMNVAITAHPVNADTIAEIARMAKAMGISDAGYQTPSSGGGTYGAVMPQSMSGALSSLEMHSGRKLSLKQVCKVLRKKFPLAGERELEEVAKVWIRAAKCG